MSQCCGGQKDANKPDVASSAGPLEWFAGMLNHCHDYARAAKSAGKPVVGILCEFTPRELIMAAGACRSAFAAGRPRRFPRPKNICRPISAR